MVAGEMVSITVRATGPAVLLEALPLRTEIIIILAVLVIFILLAVILLEH
jgi:hypothetical protein